MREVDCHEYKAVFPSCPHVYNTVDFTELNRHKVDAVHYLLCDGSHPKFGIVLGERNGVLLSPFSAPFGGFSYHRNHYITGMEKAVSELKLYLNATNQTARITLPPLAYNMAEQSKWAAMMHTHGRLVGTDLNFSFTLSKVDNYWKVLQCNAANMLRRSMENDFELQVVSSTDTAAVETAYNVILQNHAEHGYPLRMTLDEVLNTIRIIPAHFFLLTLHGEPVAAAQVFDVTPQVAQVINWGHLKEYSPLRPMNLLAYRLFEFYRRQGHTMLDIGPCRADGELNIGLCYFKESIGCEASPKYVFQL